LLRHYLFVWADQQKIAAAQRWLRCNPLFAQVTKLENAVWARRSR
jgi:hypothetical protein